MSLISSLVQLVVFSIICVVIYIFLPRKGQKAVNRIILRLRRKVYEAIVGFIDDAEEIRKENRQKIKKVG